MEYLSFKSPRRCIIVLVSALWLAASARADLSGASSAPLTQSEMAAVMQEIQAMVATDESRVSDFVVRAATPDRIERFFRMPDLPKLPRNIRENGLIFAGLGTGLLTFDKPSDLIAKVAGWFPDEVARARQSKDRRFFGHFHLYGPFENWGLEAASFLSLWNCMPENAWLAPASNPFQRRLSDSIPLYPIAARQSSYEEFDFGFCVRERSGYRGGRTQSEYKANQQAMRQLGEPIVSVLRDKFADFLTEHRCRGSGPDDCVLVLRLWASLDATDRRLAAALQVLEAEIGPDAPLPAHLKAFTDWASSEPGDGEARFDAGLRRAAYLRAKLLSVLNAPVAWPSDALPTTLRQMTELRQVFADPFVGRWTQYAIDYRNDPINPWLILPHAQNARGPLRSALLAELDRIEDDADCAVHKQWFDHGGTSLQSAHALKRLALGHPARCAGPDWAWLKQPGDPAARRVRSGYLDLLGKLSGHDQDNMLTGLTDAGDGCFDRKKLAAAGWLRRICRVWISEPQSVRKSSGMLSNELSNKLSEKSSTKSRSLKLVRSRLALGRKDGFISTGLATEQDGLPVGLDGWLSGLIVDAEGEVAKDMRDIAAELGRQGVRVYSAKQWRHPGMKGGLIELGIGRDAHMLAGTLQIQNPLGGGPLTVDRAETGMPDWMLGGQRLLLRVESRSARLVGVPGRFGYQYDEGEIAHVSDLDRDGNLEVWFSGTFGECDGEDLKPGIDCAFETIHMGEIRGDAVSYFSKTSSVRQRKRTRVGVAASSR